MTISIRVKSAAAKNEIKKIGENRWVVYVTQIAHDNKANEAVIKIIAKELGVAKSRIIIKKGSKSKEKTIEVI